MIKNYLLFSFLVTPVKLFLLEACFLAVNNFGSLVFKISGQTIAAQLQSATVTSSSIGNSILFNTIKK
jgi:hypothetical protein